MRAFFYSRLFEAIVIVLILAGAVMDFMRVFFQEVRPVAFALVEGITSLVAGAMLLIRLIDMMRPRIRSAGRRPFTEEEERADDSGS